MQRSTLKLCQSCTKTKPLAEFFHSDECDAFHPFCKPCLAQTLKYRSKERAAQKKTSRKTCAQCQQHLPLKMFHWLEASQSHHSYCRACHAVYMSERYRRATQRARLGKKGLLVAGRGLEPRTN